MAATSDQIFEALCSITTERKATAFLKKLGEDKTAEFLCSLDPVFFIKHYIKIRSQPDKEEDENDELDVFYREQGPSAITYLDLWPKQVELIDSLQRYHWVIGPKSRKIGFTTVGIAFGCWIQCFMPNTRVHYISRRDDAASNMVARHKFSMKNLPEWMRRKEVSSSGHTYSVSGVTGDERIVQAYPATEDTAIEETADYTLLDEFASIREPTAGRLWAGLEPTIAPGGYILIISRGKGPQGTFAQLVRRAALEAAV